MYEESLVGFEPIKDDVIDEPLSKMVFKLVLTALTLVLFLGSLGYAYHSWNYNRNHAMKTATYSVKVNDVASLHSDGNGNYIIPASDIGEVVIPATELDIKISSLTYPYLEKTEPSGNCKPLMFCPEKPVHYTLYLTDSPSDLAIQR